MADRFKQTGDAIVAGLRCLRGVGDAGHQSAGDLAVGLATILRLRLGPCERLYGAIAFLKSLDRDTAEELAEGALGDIRFGPPVPPFLGVRDEARDWAALASRSELRAYLGAIWGRIPDTEKARFLSAAKPKRRAA